MWITKKFKGYFFKGMAVLLPTILTIWIFFWGYNFIQQNISIHINRGLGPLLRFRRRCRLGLRPAGEQGRQQYGHRHGALHRGRIVVAVNPLCPGREEPSGAQ